MAACAAGGIEGERAAERREIEQYKIRRLRVRSTRFTRYLRSVANERLYRDGKRWEDRSGQ